MKKLLWIALISLSASASFAGATFNCKHAGFSNLAVQLSQGVPDGRIHFTVTTAGSDDGFSPKAGEQGDMFQDQENSRGDYLIYRSDFPSNYQGRAFEMSIKKQVTGKSSFPVSMSFSRLGSDLEFAKFDMTCTR
jgi:hypothetical protein